VCCYGLAFGGKVPGKFSPLLVDVLVNGSFVNVSVANFFLEIILLNEEALNPILVDIWVLAGGIL